MVGLSIRCPPTISLQFLLGVVQVIWNEKGRLTTALVREQRRSMFYGFLRKPEEVQPAASTLRLVLFCAKSKRVINSVKRFLFDPLCEFRATSQERTSFHRNEFLGVAVNYYYFFTMQLSYWSHSTRVGKQICELVLFLCLITLNKKRVPKVRKNLHCVSQSDVYSCQRLRLFW